MTFRAWFLSLMFWVSILLFMSFPTFWLLWIIVLQTFVYKFLCGCMFSFVLGTLRNGIAEFYAICMFNSLWNCQTVFHNCWTILHSYHQCKRVPISPHPCQQLFSVFFIVAHVSISWAQLIISNFLSLKFFKSLFD